MVQYNNEKKDYEKIFPGFIKTVNSYRIKRRFSRCELISDQERSGFRFSNNTLPGKKIFPIFFKDSLSLITNGQVLIDNNSKIIG